MKRLTRLAKVFTIFLVASLATNLTMEITVPTPEKAALVAERGWGHYYTHQLRGLVFFNVLFSLAGSAVFIAGSYRTLEMGALSTVLGFAFESAFMRPDWVLALTALRVIPGVFAALVVSPFYWFIAWGFPAYVTHRFFGGIP